MSRIRAPKQNKAGSEYIPQDNTFADDGSPLPPIDMTYNSKEFFNPASGGGGGGDTESLSSSQSFRCTPLADRQLEIFLNSKRFPYYVTKGDMLRHALHRHLIFLSRLAPELPSMLPAIESIKETQRHQYDMAVFEDQFAAIEKTIGMLASRGQWDQARQMVTKIYQDAKRIEDEHWRDYYTTQLEKKHQHLIITEGTSLLEV